MGLIGSSPKYALWHTLVRLLQKSWQLLRNKTWAQGFSRMSHLTHSFNFIIRTVNPQQHFKAIFSTDKVLEKIDQKNIIKKSDKNLFLPKCDFENSSGFWIFRLSGFQCMKDTRKTLPNDLFRKRAVGGRLESANKSAVKSVWFWKQKNTSWSFWSSEPIRAPAQWKNSYFISNENQK